MAKASPSKILNANVPALQAYGKVLKKIGKLHKNMTSSDPTANSESNDVVKELEHNLSRLDQITQILESQ